MYRVRAKSIIKAGIIILFLIIIVAYSYTKSKNLVGGPEITIVHPINGSVSTSSPIEIIGVAKNINALSLNDRTIFIDEIGNFKETVLLSEGYNAIRLTAKDKFGSEISHTIELIQKSDL